MAHVKLNKIKLANKGYKKSLRRKKRRTPKPMQAERKLRRIERESRRLNLDEDN